MNGSGMNEKWAQNPCGSSRIVREPVIPLAARNAAVVPVIDGTEAISSLDCGPMKPGKSE